MLISKKEKARKKISGRRVSLQDSTWS